MKKLTQLKSVLKRLNKKITIIYVLVKRRLFLDALSHLYLRVCPSVRSASSYTTQMTHRVARLGLLSILPDKIPSECMYVSSLTFKAPSKHVAKLKPRPMINKLFFSMS